MSQINKKCIYNRNNSLTILNKNKGQISERTLNLSINNYGDCLEIKIRDPLEYAFNYSETINSASYDVMRLNQNLDINFSEFKSNLLEMLQQFQDGELYLKCEISDEVCTMIFYGRSKIKCIVYLTVDLQATNQKEILAELISSMQEIQGFNEKLKKQLSVMKNAVYEKDKQIKTLELLESQLEGQYYQHLKQLESAFNYKFKEVENLLGNKLLIIKQRILKLLKDVEVLKQDSNSKAESSTRLLRLMENLKIESDDNNSLINTLKIENNALTAEKVNSERCIADLRTTLNEKESHCNELQRKNKELHADLEKATIIIAQKKSMIDELSHDLLQANQMLVNFNKHFDDKVKQIEELESVLKLRENTIKDEQNRLLDMSNEFERYRQKFNNDNQEKLSQELSLANNKIVDLEKTIRKVNKINVLLTEKVNEYGFPHQKKA